MRSLRINDPSSKIDIDWKNALEGLEGTINLIQIHDVIASQTLQGT